MDNLELLTSNNKEYFSNELNQVLNQLIDWKIDNNQVHDPQSQDNSIQLDELPKNSK